MVLAKGATNPAWAKALVDSCYINFMSKNSLIIVTGLSATGKTNLSRKLSLCMGLPLLSKDTIKEILFDEVGCGDRKWGDKLDKAAYSILTYVVKQELMANHSVIVETPYGMEFLNEMSLELQAKHRFMCVQILCYARPKILVKRYMDRIGAHDRHPGHNDLAGLEDFKISLKNAGKVDPLTLAGKVYQINTSDFANVDEEALFKDIQDVVESAAR